MILIWRALAAAGVLSLLLADSRSDDTESYNTNAVSKNVQSKETCSDEPIRLNDGYFHCDYDGLSIPTWKICDGRYDCNDGRDEVCYSGQCDNINECRCPYNNQCIQRNQSHFYLYDYSRYTRSYLHVRPGDAMTLECPIGHRKNFVKISRISWYRNGTNVPPKCRTIGPTESNPGVQLYCSNMTTEDEGIYTCANSQYYPNYENHNMGVEVSVKAKSVSKEDSCFCYGTGSRCRTNVRRTNQEQVKLYSRSRRPLALKTLITGKTKTLQWRNLKRNDTVEMLSEFENASIYYVLSEEIINKKLQLFDGWFITETSLTANSPEINGPLALMHTADRALAFYENDSEYSQLQTLSFSKNNWYIFRRGQVMGKASEAEVVAVLQNLVGIFLKLNVILDHCQIPHTTVTLNLVEYSYNGTKMPSSTGPCICQPGYTEHYIEDPTKNISCVPSADGKTTINNNTLKKPFFKISNFVQTFRNTDSKDVQHKGQNDGYFQCLDSKRKIPFWKLCDGRYDCDDGRDEVCFSAQCADINECRCQYSNQCVQRNQSHFYLYERQAYTTPHHHVKPKDTMILECPISHTSDFLEINWYRNDQGVPSKCQFLSPTESNFVSRLYCPNMKVADEGLYSCEHVHVDGNYNELYYYYIDVVVFVKKESVFEIDSCFCFGVTTTCHSKNVTEDRGKVKLFSESLPPILLTAANHGKTARVNYTTFEGKKINEILPSKANGTVYCALSEEISSRNLGLYGGSFTYLFSPDSTLVNENSPLAVMRGDDKVLVYYENGKYNKYSYHRRLSFSKHNWHLVHGNSVSEDSVSEAEIMKVLNNLKGIYLQIYYDFEDYAVNYSTVELFLHRFQFSGMGIPTSIGMCSCPAGYDGIYCERCAENYLGDPTKGSPCVPEIGS